MLRVQSVVASRISQGQTPTNLKHNWQRHGFTHPTTLHRLATVAMCNDESEISGRLEVAVVVVELGMALGSAIAEASEVLFPSEFDIANGTVTLLGND